MIWVASLVKALQFFCSSIVGDKIYPGEIPSDFEALAEMSVGASSTYIHGYGMLNAYVEVEE